MCLDAIDFFRENNIEYTEYLTTDENFNTKLSEYKEKADYVSSGVSTTFGYYPMIFIGDKAFSGFNDEIEKEILETI
jgi:glutaredoxin